MKSLVLFSFLFLSSFFYSQVSEMDKFIDNWHKAASESNFSAYFDLMDERSVFIGTAPNERWEKNEFMTFSKPYFDAGKAWDFKAKNRKWDFSNDSLTAWFDEDLDTWMQSCRGVGIVVKTKTGWKIAFYDLHVLIENEKIKEFIELRKK